MSRYLRNRSVSVFTSIPSATLVTHAGNNLLGAGNFDQAKTARAEVAQTFQVAKSREF